jgi:hypothetical protein
MARQIIDIGATGNDGTGDDLRTGATKINDNFQEVYGDIAALQIATGSAGGLDGIAFDTKTIVFEGATDDNFETRLGAIDPTKDNAVNLPDSGGTLALIADISRVIDSAYVSRITGTAFDSASTLTLIDDNSLDSTEAINLIDSAYVASRSFIEDSDNFLTKMHAIRGDVVPYADSTYDLGDSNYKWKDLWLSGTTIHLGDATITNDGSNIAFGRPVEAEIVANNSMEMKDNIIQSTLGTDNVLKFRAVNGFRFSTNDGVDLVSIRSGNVYMGDSLGFGNYLHLNRASTSNIANSARKKGMLSYDTDKEKFAFKDSDGVFTLPRDVIGDSDLQATVDSDYVQARAVELDLRNYTVSSVPTGSHGKMIFVTNGASGNPCLAVYDSDAGFYKRIALGAQIST